jgi:hypothetical protein
MAITRALADTYFNSHTEKELWYAFDNVQRDNGVTMAKRRLTEEISAPKYTLTGTTPTTQNRVLDEDTTSDGDWPREDLAVYEQALHMMLYSMSNPNGEKNGPKWLAPDVEERREQGVTANDICNRARHYMGWNFRKLHVEFTR